MKQALGIKLLVKVGVSGWGRCRACAIVLAQILSRSHVRSQEDLKDILVGLDVVFEFLECDQLVAISIRLLEEFIYLGLDLEHLRRSLLLERLEAAEDVRHEDHELVLSQELIAIEVI